MQCCNIFHQIVMKPCFITVCHLCEQGKFVIYSIIGAFVFGTLHVYLFSLYLAVYVIIIKAQL